MKAPGTLTEWTRLFIVNDWSSTDELVAICKELLEYFGPDKLDEIIKETQECKKEFEGDAE